MAEKAASNTLAYQSRVGSATALPPQLWGPAISLLPPAFLVLWILLLARFGHKWMGIGQGWEILLGSVWITVAIWSFASIIVLAIRRKRWLHILALVLHAIVVLLTVLPPGCVAIAWLMHWMTGPGA